MVAAKEKKKSYLVETTNFYGDVAKMTAYLEERLSDGWELVAMEGTTFYFKAIV